MSVTPNEKVQAAAFPVPAGNADSTTSQSCPVHPPAAAAHLPAAAQALLHLGAHSALEIK